MLSKGQTMNIKIYNAILSMMDFEQPLEPQVSDLFFNGEDIEECPTHAKDLAKWISAKVLENYFRNVWRPNWSNYRYSNEGVAFKINITNPERVIDIGCGDNILKDRIPNLLGVDPYNSNADVECDILDLDEKDESFDHAIAFGSINFGNEEDIKPRLKKAIDLVKSGGILFFRVNPGIQHVSESAKWVHFFDWDEDKINSYAEEYGCTVQNLHWEREGADEKQPRIYFELVKN